ncbi:hypothetical protein [Streptomyces bicolor]|uniref:hypothetical protein n=1 Tax=Streptomyces bicolor TaxID=66874 RepID=UPI0004E1AC15|nr:hypothetical protein [Streptomyces bicolor]
MNTERPENDDTGADGSAEEQGVREEKGTADTEASGVAKDGTAAPGAEDEHVAGATGTGGGDDAGATATADEPDAEAAETGGEEIDRGAAVGAESGRVGAPDRAAALEEGGVGGEARRRSPAIIASVAAAVLLVGGGGAYLAANASGGSDGGTTSAAPGDDTPPPLRLDGYTGGDTPGIAPGEPNPYGVTYKADGELADGPGSAPVYRAGGEVGADEVARLAEALGVDGTPVAQGQTWRVGATDGAGPSLQVNKQAPGSWTFYRYAPGTDNCQSTTVCQKDSAGPGGDPVGEEAAKKAAAPILKAVGQDDAKLDASQVMGAQRVVNADPVVDGMPTYGWTTGVTVSAQGEVVGGSGQLKAPVKGDTYPVLSAEKTLGLMNAAPASDGRMGIGGCASPVPLKDRLEAPCGAEASTGATPSKDTVTVEKAVFGLASHFVDARQALVPSWLFEVKAPDARDGFTVTYPAIDPEFLAPATPSEEPTGQPTPRPTDPKDEPTSAPVTRNVAVDGYTADGSELTVAYTGGVCADYKVTADESEGEVTVRVTETSQPEEICIQIAKLFHKTVQLDEPLGDRKVVGTDGQAIPKEKPGAGVPETSGAR